MLITTHRNTSVPRNPAVTRAAKKSHKNRIIQVFAPFCSLAFLLIPCNPESRVLGNHRAISPFVDNFRLADY